MNALLLSARCLLAVVFLIAAVGKALDLPGSRQALKEFGVPSSLAHVAGTALPAAELTVAVALLIRPVAVAGAIGALLLLVTFIAGLTYAMSQDRAPNCHCFGQIHSEPAGPTTLARNAALAALAALVVVAGPGPSLIGGLSDLNGTQIALVATSVTTAIFAAAAAQLWGDKRRLADELERVRAARMPPGLPRGSRAPDFSLPAIRGTTGSLKHLLSDGRPIVLVFVSTSCGPCLDMLPALRSWQTLLSHSLALPAIFSGEPTDVKRISEEHDLTLALAQEEDAIFNAYALRATPSAVLVTADGTIAGAPAEGVPAIEALVRTTLAADEPRTLAVHR